MTKLYTTTAVKNFIDKYIDEYGGKLFEIEEGSLGYGKILLYGAVGRRKVVITEVFLNAWSSAHKVRQYKKIPKKYRDLIQ